MELLLALEIVRRSWRAVAAVALAAAVASLAAGLLQEPRYSASAQLLVTLADVTRVDIEDPLAYDVAAIVRGRPLAEDVAASLADQGRPIGADAVAAMLSASNQKRLVTISAESRDPTLPPIVLAAVAEQLQRGGLRYWGEAAILPDRPGISIVVLSMPSAAERRNSPSAIAREVALRTLAGAAAGAAAVLIWHFMSHRKRYAAD